VGSLALLILCKLIVGPLRSQLEGFRLIKFLIAWNLMLTFLLIFIGNARKFHLKEEEKGFCIFIAIALQYFGLSTFFWMTSLGYTIWSRLTLIEEPRPVQIRPFALFSVGAPLLISSVTLILQLQPDDYSDYDNRNSNSKAQIFSMKDSSSIPQTQPPFQHPGIGRNSCFFGSDLSKFLYFYLINLILVLLNLVFFLLTTYQMYCGTWRATSRSFRQTHSRIQQKFNVLVKIFLMVGITWLAEFVYVLLDWKNKESLLAIPWLRIVLETFNLSTGILFLVEFLSLKGNREILVGWMEEQLRRWNTLLLARDTNTSLRSRRSFNTQISWALSSQVQRQNSAPEKGQTNHGADIELDDVVEDCKTPDRTRSSSGESIIL